MRGTYVYGLMQGEPHLRLEGGGLPDGTTPVSGVSAGGFTAVVSQYQGSAFEELSRADLLQSLLLYQRVIEAAMGEGALIPAKFGTVLRSEEEVRDTLNRFQARLADAFADVGDAVEIDLSATWDVNAVLADVAGDAQLRAAGTASNPSAKDLDERVRLGSLVAEALEQRRNEYRQRAVRELAPLARDLQSNPLPAEDLVFNLAFLVNREDLARFEAAVDRLGEDLGDTLTFRYVGPLAPHSFATVELTHLSASEIEAARQVMGLGDRISLAELRRRYRGLAAGYHPDRNRDDEEAHRRFSDLTAAYETLDRSIRGQRETVERPDEDRQYDLTTDALAETVLLEITRADVEPRAGRRVTHEPEPAR